MTMGITVMGNGGMYGHGGNGHIDVSVVTAVVMDVTEVIVMMAPATSNGAMTMLG